MTPEETLMKLSATARRDLPPAVDVTDKVRTILAQLSSQPVVISTRPLAWVAAAVSVAAVIAIVTALQFTTATDSMTEITNSIAWVTR
jgi:hypothetical protein